MDMNKPVAYMRLTGDRVTRISLEKVWDSDIPLYTHPPAQQWTIEAKFKELTDDEIHDLMDEIRNAVGDDIERAMYRMARAILRKAQNK